MKHLNALHRRVNNPYAVAQESIGEIAMEGLAEAAKEKWALIKSAFKPNDAAKAAKQMEALLKIRKDVVQAKGALSQSNGHNEAIPVKIKGDLGKFPVSGKNADELIANLSAWRKKTDAQIKKIAQIKDEAQAAAATKELQAQTQGGGQLPAEMTFTRQQGLKLMDEMIATIDVVHAAYKLTVDAQKKARAQGVATESFSDVETVDQAIALEGVGEVIWGIIKMYVGYFLYVWGAIAAIGTFGLLVTGAIIPALIAGGVSYALFKGGNSLFIGGLNNVGNTVDKAMNKAGDDSSGGMPADISKSKFLTRNGDLIMLGRELHGAEKEEWNAAVRYSAGREIDRRKAEGTWEEPAASAA